MTTGPEIYVKTRRRLLDLAATLDESQHEMPVPATPLWTIRETYAHLVGVAADSLADNLDDLGKAHWTAKQVSDRADRSLAEICAEWTGNAEAFDAAIHTDQQLWGNAFDLWTHEQDIHAALGAPVNREEATVRFALDIIVGGANAYWPPNAQSVRLVADDLDSEWRLGEGATETAVHASGYELVRAVSGRRSRAQVAALGWDNPAPHLEPMPAFEFAEQDMID